MTVPLIISGALGTVSKSLQKWLEKIKNTKKNRNPQNKSEKGLEY